MKRKHTKMLQLILNYKKEYAMAPETEELIKLVASADDADKAALTAFAILLDYLSRKKCPRESTPRKNVSPSTYAS